MDLLGEPLSFLSTNTTPSLISPVMSFFSTALLLGSLAVQTVFGRPGQGTLSRRAVDDFITRETPIALDQLLCNIGSDGCHSSGVAPGLVIASPSKSNPDYFYTWTRDSSLVFKAVIDRFTNEYDEGLQKHIQDFVLSQAKLQGVGNPSGGLSDGKGLGEPKFKVDFSAYTDSWGRPQRDGPALRAIALISYAKWLVNNGYTSTARSIVWPIARNDLNYVAQYWNQTGFDLWEEVNGSSFFTISSSHRALVEGSDLASLLGEDGSSYASVAPSALCFLQSFWIPQGGYVDSNINVNDGRTGKDVNSILTSIHVFDPAAGCDAATFQPCSDKALSNLKQVVESFGVWNINKGLPSGSALAVGRYSEDVYYSGNPWYLATLAAAEQLYDALYVWKQQKSITVTSTSLAFFQSRVSGISAGTYKSDSDTYTNIINAVSVYADSFVSIVEKYTPSSGSLAEQFDKNNGSPLSASDLTWSYAAFLTAADRRGGIVPPSWLSDSAKQLPTSCQRAAVQGSYSSVSPSPFPPSQTPVSGAPPKSTTTATGTATGTATATSCPTATAVAVTFEQRVVTQFGDTVKLTGNIPALGNWDTSKAITLSASDYTSSNPVWKTTITLPAGQTFQYKFVNVKSGGSVTWEKDPNRSYSVPKSCSTTTTLSSSWQ